MEVLISGAWLFVASMIVFCSTMLGVDSHPSSVGRVYLAAIVVPDLDSAAAWYRKHLGFQTEEVLSFPQVRISFLHTQNLRLEIVEDKRAFTQAALEKRIPELGNLDNRVAGIEKLAFCLRDFDSNASRLKSEGVQFQTAIIKANARWPRSFIVLDNNQNWIQFFDCGNWLTQSEFGAIIRLWSEGASPGDGTTCRLCPSRVTATRVLRRPIELWSRTLEACKLPSGYKENRNLMVQCAHHRAFAHEVV